MKMFLLFLDRGWKLFHTKFPGQTNRMILDRICCVSETSSRSAILKSMLVLNLCWSLPSLLAAVPPWHPAAAPRAVFHSPRLVLRRRRRAAEHSLASVKEGKEGGKERKESLQKKADEGLSSETFCSLGNFASQQWTLLRFAVVNSKWCRYTEECRVVVFFAIVVVVVNKVNISIRFSLKEHYFVRHEPLIQPKCCNVNKLKVRYVGFRGIY